MRGCAPSGETPGWRPSYDGLHRAAECLITLSAARVFNTENRLFSHGCSFARKYAKIRTYWFSVTSLRHPAAGMPEKRKFRRYMSQIDPNFPPKTGLGSKIPWDGSANPWDGMENRWDGSIARPHGYTKKPHGRVENSLERRRRRVSALTQCHIAHRGRAALPKACLGDRRRPAATARGALRRKKAAFPLLVWRAWRNFASRSNASKLQTDTA